MLRRVKSKLARVCSEIEAVIPTIGEKPVRERVQESLRATRAVLEKPGPTNRKLIDTRNSLHTTEVEISESHASR